MKRLDSCHQVRVPDWLHHELINWARWCWSGRWPHPLPADHCGSAEHVYSRYPREYADDEIRSLPPNETHAQIVDVVWHRLPAGPRQVLRAEYPQYHASGRAEFGRIGAARRLGMRLHDYEAALWFACGRVRDAFEDRR